MTETARDHRMFSTTGDFDPMPYEVDFTGYVSNTVATRWMEMLRVKMMRLHFAEIDTGAREYLSVITRTEVDYVDAIRYGECIRGSAWISAVAIARWHIGFEFRNVATQKVVIAANQTGTFLNPVSFRPVRVPDAIREKFLESMDAVA